MLDLSSWTNDNTLSLIAMFFVFAGGIFALWRWSKGVKLQRAEYVKQLIEKLRFDDSIVEAAYMIDYDPCWYNEHFHKDENRQMESRVDKYLPYLSYLCYLIDINGLTKKEIILFEYKLVRAAQSPSVQAYLWNLYHFGKKFGIKHSGYSLMKYGIKRKAVDNDFFINNKKFEKNIFF
ncbi:MAG: hypothetical protein FWE11_09680 [Defluviitaleaceae bacterium]|nr:hypothetical protein [Defluviitaleaceae bacterium]